MKTCCDPLIRIVSARQFYKGVTTCVFMNKMENSPYCISVIPYRFLSGALNRAPGTGGFDNKPCLTNMVGVALNNLSL